MTPDQCTPGRAVRLARPENPAHRYKGRVGRVVEVSPGHEKPARPGTTPKRYPDLAWVHFAEAVGERPIGDPMHDGKGRTVPCLVSGLEDA